MPVFRVNLNITLCHYEACDLRTLWGLVAFVRCKGASVKGERMAMASRQIAAAETQAFQPC